MECSGNTYLKYIYASPIQLFAVLIAEVPLVFGRILNFLEDGSWHTPEEIKTDLGVSEGYLGKVIRFLVEYGFIDIAEDGRNVRLNSSFLQLPS